MAYTKKKHIDRALEAADTAYKRIAYLWDLKPAEEPATQSFAYDLALAAIKWIADKPKIIETTVFEALDVSLRLLSNPFGVLTRDGKENGERERDVVRFRIDGLPPKSEDYDRLTKELNLSQDQLTAWRLRINRANSRMEGLIRDALDKQYDDRPQIKGAYHVRVTYEYREAQPGFRFFSYDCILSALFYLNIVESNFHHDYLLSVQLANRQIADGEPGTLIELFPEHIQDMGLPSPALHNRVPQFDRNWDYKDKT